MSEEVEQCWSTSQTAVADARSQGGLEGAPRCGSCPLKSQHTFLVAFMDRKEKVFHFIEHIVVEPL